MKNTVMEYIQKYYDETPEVGVNYVEIVNRIGGSDHQPIFRAFVGLKESDTVMVTGTVGESKKLLLKRAWKQYVEGSDFL